MNVNPIDMWKYLKSTDYPVSGEGLASTAESNDAPGDLGERLRSLGDEAFSGPDQVMAALKRS